MFICLLCLFHSRLLVLSLPVLQIEVIHHRSILKKFLARWMFPLELVNEIVLRDLVGYTDSSGHMYCLSIIEQKENQTAELIYMFLNF